MVCYNIDCCNIEYIKWATNLDSDKEIFTLQFILFDQVSIRIPYNLL